MKKSKAWDIETIEGVNILDKYNAPFTYLLSSNSESKYEESFVAFLGYDFNLEEFMSLNDIKLLINNDSIYKIMKRMILSVEFLHKNNVLHGNITPQSFLLKSIQNSEKVYKRDRKPSDLSSDYHVAISHFEYATRFKSIILKSKKIGKLLVKERKELGRIFAWMLKKTKSNNPENLLNQRHLIKAAIKELIENGKQINLGHLKEVIPVEVL